MKARAFTLIDTLIALAIMALLGVGGLFILPKGDPLKREFGSLSRWVQRCCIVSDRSSYPVRFTLLGTSSRFPKGAILVTGAEKSRFVPTVGQLSATHSSWTYRPGTNTFSPAGKIYLTEGTERYQLILSGRGLIREVRRK